MPGDLSNWPLCDQQIQDAGQVWKDHAESNVTQNGATYEGWRGMQACGSAPQNSKHQAGTASCHLFHVLGGVRIVLIIQAAVQVDSYTGDFFFIF